MKFILALLFLAGLACAQETTELKEGPNPDADAYYGYYGHPGYYGGYGRYGGYGGRYYGGYGGYYGHGYGYYGRKKRDAEADPAVLASTSAVKTPEVYTHPYTYGFPYAHHVGAAPYAVDHKGKVLFYTVPLTYNDPSIPVLPQFRNQQIKLKLPPGLTAPLTYTHGLAYAHHYPYTYGLHHALSYQDPIVKPWTPEERKKRDAAPGYEQPAYVVEPPSL